MSTAEQEREEQTVVGEITGTITKGTDTWQVSVLPENSQYTKNLWTKDAEVVGDMNVRIGQKATFFCNVSHWTRQDGQSVRSLWISGWTQNGADPQSPLPLSDEVAQAQEALARAQAAQAAAQQAAAQQVAQEAQPPQAQAQISQNEKEIRIMREAADKCAAEVLAAVILAGGLKEEDLTPERIHGFMDAFSQKRIRFYETGSSLRDDSEEIPF